MSKWFLVMERIAMKMGSIGDRFGGEKLAGDVSWMRDGEIYRGNRYLGYTSRERAERQALEFINRPGGSRSERARLDRAAQARSI